MLQPQNPILESQGPSLNGPNRDERLNSSVVRRSS